MGWQGRQWGKKRSNFQGLRFWAGWLCGLEYGAKKSKTRLAILVNYSRFGHICAFVVVWEGWRFRCAGCAGTVGKRAENALENCPAGSPKQWVQLAEHRLEKGSPKHEISPIRTISAKDLKTYFERRRAEK
jgi:hypothetical protein